MRAENLLPDASTAVPGTHKLVMAGLNVLLSEFLENSAETSRVQLCR